MKIELCRLVAAVAEGGHSAFLLNAIAEREHELMKIQERLSSNGADSADGRTEEIRQFVTSRLCDLRRLLYTDVAVARAELGKHINEIRMIPQEDHYAAVGAWDLLGGYPETGQLSQGWGVRARLVAGAQAQRFLSAHGPIQNLFRVGRHHLKAIHHPTPP